MDTAAARRLVSAIIEAAVVEYRLLQKRGWLVGLRANLPRAPRGRYVKLGTYRYASDVRELIYFFKSGGTMDHWLDIAQIDLDGDMIRRKLGIIQQHQCPDTDLGLQA